MKSRPRPRNSAPAPAGGADPRALLAAVHAVARDAGKALLAVRGQDLGVARKQGLDIVTAGDLAAEKAVLAGLGRLLPGVPVLSEEGPAAVPPARGRWWVVDPLDGTVNFAAGLPTFAVAIGLKNGARTELGVVHMPAFGHDFVLAGGARAGGSGFAASTTRRLADAVVSVTVTSHYAPALFTRAMRVIDRLARRCRGVRIVVCGAYELAAVATGALDGHVCLAADIFSICASLPMVAAGGGRVTHLDGRRFADTHPTLDLVASNGRIHGELLACLAAARAAG
jgi:myo-inositol-1(or 4)-monophosphatase